MLIDNKNQNNPKNSKTLYDFFVKYIQEGNFDVVSGYFSVPMLADSFDKFKKIAKFRMILGELSEAAKKDNAEVDLLENKPSIIGTFQLASNAKKAVQFLQQSHVELKTYEDKFCHAKAYLYENSTEPNQSFFSVGSSNYTHAGLKNTPNSNIELNVAKTGEDEDFEGLKTWFNLIWKEAKTDITTEDKKKKNYKEYVIEQVKKLFYAYTPEEIYHKILFELFYDDIKNTASKDTEKQLTHLKETAIWKKLFDFQQKGVLSLIRMLQNYGGAILADAVGLGKTWQALAVMKYYEMEGYNVILLCPKKLEQNWTKYLFKRKSIFETDKFLYTVCYHTDLQDRRLEREAGLTLENHFQNNNKLLFVIDESHNLRNDASRRYQFLVNELLKKDKQKPNAALKVLLLSATPINTKITDLRNQFKLLVKGENDGFKENLHINSLEKVFKDVQEQFNKWEVQNKSNNIPLKDFFSSIEQDFYKLNDALVVARTRKMIEKTLQKDLQFPVKAKPVNIYHLPKEFGELETPEQIISALEDLHFWGYQPAKYVKTKAEWEKDSKDATENEALRQGFLARMMFFLLMKRLESSWVSFQSTLNNMLKHHENALAKVIAFRENRANKNVQQNIYAEDLTPEVQAQLDESAETDSENAQKISQEIEKYSLGKNKEKAIKLSDMRYIGRFEEDLQAEVKKLRLIAKQVQKYAENIEKNKQKDDKLAALVQAINEKRANAANKKVLIFTAFKDTANYLFEALQKQLPNENIAYIAGDEHRAMIKNEKRSFKTFETILEYFAPYTKLFKEKEWQNLYDTHNKKEVIADFEAWKTFVSQHEKGIKEQLENPIDLLIATDCISEGQNLQDCDCVINYDIHWNPVRIIQRFGRIDRIGSPNATVSVVNFWVGENFENAMNLKNRVEKRMAMMALVGTEIIDNLTEKLEQLMAENPLVSQQEEKMLKQMQISWDDIEAGGQTLSLADFSMEIFRQELLAYLIENKDRLQKMPNHVFSGFGLEKEQLLGSKNLADLTPTNVVALLKHKETKDLRLVLANEEGKGIFVNNFFALQFLSAYKKAVRDNKTLARIENNEQDFIQSLADMLKKYLSLQTQIEIKADLKKAAKGGLGASLFVGKQENAANSYFEADKFELIVWETVKVED
jgi:superfamily II DNA or RNA helicase